MSTNPSDSRGMEPQANPYRTHLVAVANDLHRKLTGMRTGTSAYKYNYGRWLQASEDLVAYEKLGGGESASGGLSLYLSRLAHSYEHNSPAVSPEAAAARTEALRVISNIQSEMGQP